MHGVHVLDYVTKTPQHDDNPFRGISPPRDSSFKAPLDPKGSLPPKSSIKKKNLFPKSMFEIWTLDYL